MSALPPAQAGVGSAINDLDRELGGAFGVGRLGSLTLARYKADVAGAPDTLAPAAREGLAQATAVARTPPAVQSARTAFADDLDIAMLVGSSCVLATAVVVAWKMPRHNPAQPGHPAAVLAQTPAGGRKD